MPILCNCDRLKHLFLFLPALSALVRGMLRGSNVSPRTISARPLGRCFAFSAKPLRRHPVKITHFGFPFLCLPIEKPVSRRTFGITGFSILAPLNGDQPERKWF
jgi:hypothetical protein